MESAKEKAIREAYEALGFDNAKPDEKGYIRWTCYPTTNFDLSIWDKKKPVGSKSWRDVLFRPKSLQGIETNNGWTRIESEADLPTETKSYHVMYEDGTIIQHHFSIKSDFDRILFLEEFTHWQEILIPNPPIY